MDVPTSFAAKSSMYQYNNATISKGTARNREQTRFIQKIENINTKSSARMELWRTCEVRIEEGMLHDSVAEALGVEQDYVSEIKQVKYGLVTEPTYFKKSQYRERGKPTVFRLGHLPKHYIKKIS